MSYRKILVAVDFSDPSHLALREAAELVAKYGGELTVVHVRDGLSLHGLTSHPADERLLPTRHALEDQLMREWHDEAARRSERPVRAVQLEGVAWEAIVGHARSGDFDLVVVGAHAGGGGAAALLGSVAEKVVRHASCPVFVVRVKARP